MNRKVKKLSILFFSTIVILLIFLLYWYNFQDSNKIKKTMNGVIINKETKKVIDYVTVTMDGKVNKDGYLSIFQGNMHFSNLEYTKEDIASFYYYPEYADSNNKQGEATYPTALWKDGHLQGDFFQLHWLNFDLDFSYLIVSNYDEDSIHHEGEYSIRAFNGTDIMVFPANDAKTALKILEEHYINNDVFKKTELTDYETIEDFP